MNQLKIDKSFMDKVLEDHSDRKIVETIITLAQALDLVVIAEGVVHFFIALVVVFQSVHNFVHGVSMGLEYKVTDVVQGICRIGKTLCQKFALCGHSAWQNSLLCQKARDAGRFSVSGLGMMKGRWGCGAMPSSP